MSLTRSTVSVKASSAVCPVLDRHFSGSPGGRTAKPLGSPLMGRIGRTLTWRALVIPPDAPFRSRTGAETTGLRRVGAQPVLTVNPEPWRDFSGPPRSLTGSRWDRFAGLWSPIFEAAPFSQGLPTEDAVRAPAAARCNKPFPRAGVPTRFLHRAARVPAPSPGTVASLAWRRGVPGRYC